MQEIKHMTNREVQVLNFIRNRASFAEPIPAWRVRKKFGLSKRKLEEIIENLRVTYRQPIVAKKNQPSGYYLPRTAEERDAGLAPYRRQILTEQKNLAAVESVDLMSYWAQIEKA